jgi:hypothetical protein
MVFDSVCQVGLPLNWIPPRPGLRIHRASLLSAQDLCRAQMLNGDESPLVASLRSLAALLSLQILQFLRRRLDPADPPDIPRPRARDIEQLALGVIHVFQIRIVADRIAPEDRDSDISRMEQYPPGSRCRNPSSPRATFLLGAQHRTRIDASAAIPAVGCKICATH